MAIQQVLKAQKISFLLRGGVRVLVAMRDTDTGEGPGSSPAWPRLPLQGGVGEHPGLAGDTVTGGAGAEGSSWLGGHPQ